MSPRGTDDSQSCGDNVARLATIWEMLEERNCLCAAGESTRLGQRAGAGAGHPWGRPVALTAVSFSSALKRSSQATADFWKASCRLMRLSTSSTVQPSSALRTSGSWLQSQASAMPASLPNTSTSKTAGLGGRRKRAGQSGHWQSTVATALPEQGHRESYCPKTGTQGRARQCQGWAPWIPCPGFLVSLCSLQGTNPQPLLTGPGAPSPFPGPQSGSPSWSQSIFSCHLSAVSWRRACS